MFKLLIVDDNPSDRRGLQNMVDWKALDIEVVGLAMNGRDGCRKAEELLPDIILTDVAMPLMDGLGMAANIKEMLREVRFVFMSCFDEFAYVKSAMNLEAYGYVLKPIHLPELTAVMSRVVEEMRRVQKQQEDREQLLVQIRRSLPILREQFFTDLLYGSAGIEEISDRMRYLGLNHFGDLFTVIYVQIDFGREQTPEMTAEHSYILCQQVKNAMYSTILSVYTGYMLHQQQDSAACIVFAELKNPHEMTEQVLEEVQRLQNKLMEDGGLSVTIAVGDVSDHLPDLRHMFEKVRHAVKFRLFSQGGRILMASEVGTSGMPLPFRPDEIKEALLGELERSEGRLLNELIERHFGADSNLPEDYLKSAAVMLYFVVLTLCMDKNADPVRIAGPMDQVWDTVKSLETKADIRQWIAQILGSAAEQLGSWGKGRMGAISTQIKDIIHEHYADYTNMEQIVRPLHISANHANLLFKQHTGMTIFDYLVQVKMEQAKILLLDPYIKIYEVAERVGYRSKARFGVVFKEYTSLTPKQYMNKYAMPKER